MSASSTTRARRALRTVLVATAPLPIVAFVLLVFGAPGRLMCGEATGFAPAMLELVDACPAARERLGASLRFSALGGSLGGNYQSGEEAGEGIAYGDLPIAGTSGSGLLEYQLSRQNGAWVPSVLVLTFADGAKLDVRACSRSAIERRQTEAGEAAMRTACEQGRADACLGLAGLLAARGDPAGSDGFRAKACALGASEACPR